MRNGERRTLIELFSELWIMEDDSQELDELPEWVKLVNSIASAKKNNRKAFKLDELSIENLVLKRIRDLGQPIFPNKIIRFPLVFSKICPIYCLTKGQAWTILKRLEQHGLLEIVPYQGIRITDKRL
jgi:hypothetical protein